MMDQSVGFCAAARAGLRMVSAGSCRRRGAGMDGARHQNAGIGDAPRRIAHDGLRHLRLGRRRAVFLRDLLHRDIENPPQSGDILRIECFRLAIDHTLLSVSSERNGRRVCNGNLASGEAAERAVVMGPL